MNQAILPRHRIIIENGDIVTPTGTIPEATLVIEDGHIAMITSGECNLSGERWDVGRQLVLPGFIDLHSDALEKSIEPRIRSVFPFDAAIMEYDKTLPACGVTTMFHCIAYAHGDARNSSLRSNDMADAILGEVRRLSPWLRTHTKVHIRYDVLNTSALTRLLEHAGENRIDLLSFMDHTPGQGQYRDVEAYRTRMIKDYNLSAGSVEATVARRVEAGRTVSETELQRLAETCTAHGIPLASHDDDGPAKVDRGRRLHVTISEFPVCLEALQAAKDAGMWTVFGAPNALRGASQSGNMSAAESMLGGKGDILASDYAPMSLFHAVFKLARTGKVALHDAVKWISLNPAKAVGIDRHTGSLEVGKQADLVLVNPFGPVAHITTTFTAGCLTYIGNFPFGRPVKTPATLAG